MKKQISHITLTIFILLLGSSFDFLKDTEEDKEKEANHSNTLNQNLGGDQGAISEYFYNFENDVEATYFRYNPNLMANYATYLDYYNLFGEDPTRMSFRTFPNHLLAMTKDDEAEFTQRNPIDSLTVIDSVVYDSVEMMSTPFKNLELLENLKIWFGFKYEVIYFYNVYGPNQICTGDMATVIGIFENQYIKKKPLTVVLPGSQTRRFTHIYDTVETCFFAWKQNKCRHYSISNKTSYSILQVAKMFKSKITFLRKREGERYASALTKISNNHKIINKYGKIDLKDYVTSFIKGENL